VTNFLDWLTRPLSDRHITLAFRYGLGFVACVLSMGVVFAVLYGLGRLFNSDASAARSFLFAVLWGFLWRAWRDAEREGFGIKDFVGRGVTIGDSVVVIRDGWVVDDGTIGIVGEFRGSGKDREAFISDTGGGRHGEYEWGGWYRGDEFISSVGVRP